MKKKPAIILAVIVALIVCAAFFAALYYKTAVRTPATNEPQVTQIPVTPPVPANQPDYNISCDAEQQWGQLPAPDKSVTVDLGGVTLTGSFNSSWKDPVTDHEFQPVEKDEKGNSYFGMPRFFVGGAGCNVMRDFTAAAESPSSSTDAFTQIKTQMAGTATVTKTTVNGHDVIVIDDIQGVCPAPSILVFLKNHTVQIDASCALVQVDDKNTAKDLLKIAATIKE